MDTTYSVANGFRYFETVIPRLPASDEKQTVPGRDPLDCVIK